MDSTRQKEVDDKPVVITGYYRSLPPTRRQANIEGWLWAAVFIIFFLYKLGVIS